jgi:UPF0755 protein
MTPRSRSSFLGAFFLPLVALFAIAILVLIALVLSIPGQAADRFGPPTPGLSDGRRFLLSALLLWQEHDLTQPLNPGGAEVPFNVEQGESVASITGRLWEVGLIASPGAFRSYLQYSGLDTSLKAGNYTLSPSLSAIQIAQAMQSSISSEVIFTILPGWRAEEIAAALPTSGLDITPDEFLAGIHIQPQGYSFSDELPDSSVEGFLFPDTYQLGRDTTLQELIPALLSNFEAQVTHEMRKGFEQQGLSLYQAVILASIVQREGMVAEEYPTIASVFLNRLAIGMALASDPTAQYALGYNTEQGTWWTNPLSAADLQVDSPYNTYLYPGLPPGPISNPGLPALRAVAFPAQTPYYYFRMACDGSGRHAFAETYAQHLENACP